MAVRSHDVPASRYRPDRFVPRRAAREAAGGASASGRRRILRGVVVAWLVLMTVWGFGRAADADAADAYLAAGLVAGTVAGVVVARR